MKLKRETPNITRIIYRQEPGDRHHGSCLWAIFDFDPDKGMLNIQSDCGNYAYRWPEQGKDFWELCTSVSKDYLIRKLCGRPQELDVEATLNRIREYLECKEIPVTKLRSFMGLLNDELIDCPVRDSAEMMKYVIEENWNRRYKIGIEESWNLVQTDYEYQQKEIVRIFVEDMIPEIQRMLREDAGTENENF